MDKRDDDFFARLAEAIAPRLADELRGVAGWIDQRNTPLGRNTHCAAVRRRLAEAQPGEECGAMIGGTKSAPLYKLSPRAVREELSGLGPVPLRKTRGAEPAPDSTRAHLARLEAKLRGLR